jgi:hypothetical protein
MRQLFMSRLSDWIVRRRLGHLMAQQEREVRALGTSFGRTSTERTSRLSHASARRPGSRHGMDAE